MARSKTASNNIVGKPFVPGDARINRKGRPRDLTGARALAQQIAKQVLKDKDGQPVVIEGEQVTVIQAIFHDWAMSGDPRKQEAFVEYAYGKVPSAVELTGKDGERLIPIREVVINLPDDTGDE